MATGRDASQRRVPAYDELAAAPQARPRAGRHPTHEEPGSHLSNRGDRPSGLNRERDAFLRGRTIE